MVAALRDGFKSTPGMFRDTSFKQSFNAEERKAVSVQVGSPAWPHSPSPWELRRG